MKSSKKLSDTKCIPLRLYCIKLSYVCACPDARDRLSALARVGTTRAHDPNTGGNP